MKKEKLPKREYINHLLTIEGNAYRYEESGRGERILLIPGGGMEPGLYSRIATELSRDFCVINIARIGRADMPARPEDLTLEEEADYLLPLLQTLDIRYIMGHSSGANLATVIADKLPVKGMILYEPAICDRTDWMKPFRRYRDSGHYVRAIQYAMQGMSAAPFDSLPGFITLPFFYGVYKVNTPYVLTFEKCILSEILALNAVHRQFEKGKRITTPTLCCYGDASSPMLQNATKLYYSACDRGYLKLYPKYSHINPLIDPIPFGADVRAFIKWLNAPCQGRRRRCKRHPAGTLPLRPGQTPLEKGV